MVVSRHRELKRGAEPQLLSFIFRKAKSFKRPRTAGSSTGVAALRVFGLFRDLRPKSETAFVLIAERRPCHGEELHRDSTRDHSQQAERYIYHGSLIAERVPFQKYPRAANRLPLRRLQHPSSKSRVSGWFWVVEPLCLTTARLRMGFSGPILRSRLRCPFLGHPGPFGVHHAWPTSAAMGKSTAPSDGAPISRPAAIYWAEK